MTSFWGLRRKGRSLGSLSDLFLHLCGSIRNVLQAVAHSLVALCATATEAAHYTQADSGLGRDQVFAVVL